MFSLNWSDGIRSYTIIGDARAVYAVYSLLRGKPQYSSIHAYSLSTGTEMSLESGVLM